MPVHTRVSLWTLLTFRSFLERLQGSTGVDQYNYLHSKHTQADFSGVLYLWMEQYMYSWRWKTADMRWHLGYMTTDRLVRPLAADLGHTSWLSVFRYLGIGSRSPHRLCTVCVWVLGQIVPETYLRSCSLLDVS